MKKIMTLTALLMSGFSAVSFAQAYKVQNSRCFADVNGDGKDDYIILTGDAASPTVTVRFSNGLTFDQVPGVVSHPTLFRNLTGPSYFVDINGDGRADYVTFQGNEQTPRIVAYLSTKEGFSNEHIAMSEHFDKGLEGFPRGFTDVDGDGRWDYVTFRGTPANPYIVAYLSNGYDFREQPYRSKSFIAPAQEGGIKAFADINGDRLADYMDSYDGAHINTYLGYKSPFSNKFLFPVKAELSTRINKGYEDMPRGFYDIDADNNADYVVFRGNEDKPNIYIHSSLGNYFEAKPVITSPVERGLAGMPNGFADVNGDKKPDYIAFRGTAESPKPVVYFGTGKDFLPPCDEMTVSLYNDAAYNAYFFIRYELEGVVKKFSSQVVLTGQTIDYVIPEDAYNVEVSAFCNDCYDKRRVFTDLVNRADNPSKVCYRVLGSQFKKSWDYNGCNKARK